jgi:hypothetical protein
VIFLEEIVIEKKETADLICCLKELKKEDY